RMQVEDLTDISRHPGVSANLCESLLLLRSSGDRSYLNISVSWSRAFLPANRQSKREVQLRQEVFEVAEALAPSLRSVPESRAAVFCGFVDELRGHPSANDLRPSGEVRLTLFDKGEELRARADLSADDYAVAGEAHLAYKLISLKGFLQRLPRLNRIEQVTAFE